jgi:amino acid transporter
VGQQPVLGPSLLLFAAANAATAFGQRGVALGDSRLYSAVFVLAGLWFSVGLNVLGFSVSKWLQNVGSIGTWLPAGLLIALGAAAWARFGSATSFAPAALAPHHDVLTTVSLWAAVCFAFSGFEVTSLVGQEVRNARRVVPLGVILAGLIATVIYVGGSVSVLVAMPASALDERSGIPETISIAAGRLGLPGLGGLAGLLLALGSFAMCNSWFAGAARVPFAGGVDHVLPAVLGRIHPRYRTPHVALVTQGVAASLIFLSSVFLTITGSKTSIQEAYDILVNLTILVYFVPYLYLFAALVRLRRIDRGPAPAGAIRIPGRPLVWLVALAGFATTAVSLGLLFVPPQGTANVANYEANLAWQSLVIAAVGLLLYRHSRRNAGSGVITAIPRRPV